MNDKTTDVRERLFPSPSSRDTIFPHNRMSFVSKICFNVSSVKEFSLRSVLGQKTSRTNIAILDSNLENKMEPSTSAEGAEVKKQNVLKKYFLYIVEEKEKFGKCLICEREKKSKKLIKMKDSNTTGLKKHLMSCHKEIFNKILKKDDGQLTIKQSIEQLNKSKPKTNLTQAEIQKLAAEWICIKYLPFNFFDDEVTKEFFRKLNDNVAMPKRDCLRSKVEENFEIMQKNLKTILNKNDSKISFTIDGWTSIANKSFYGITAHFIDDNWELQSVVLDFVPANGNHTGKDIASIFFSVLQKYELERKCRGITVDNAAANTTFIEELKILMNECGIEFNAKEQHFRCFAHIINLGVQDTFKLLQLKPQIFIDDDDDEEEEELIHANLSSVSKLRILFKKIRLSEQWSNKLKSCCETTNVKYLSPSMDVSTRWNSTHDMLKIGLHLKSPLNTLCDNNECFYELKINDDEWEMLEKCNTFLKWFKTVSTVLGGDKYVTIPMVVVAFNMLIDNIEKLIFKLNAKKDRNKVDEMLIIAFQAGRDKMLKHYSKTNWTYCSSLILDPRHKMESFDVTSWGQEMKTDAIKVFKEMYRNYRERERESFVMKTMKIVEMKLQHPWIYPLKTKYI